MTNPLRETWFLVSPRVSVYLLLFGVPVFLFFLKGLRTRDFNTEAAPEPESIEFGTSASKQHPEHAAQMDQTT
jgi:hypothetical protein